MEIIKNSSNTAGYSSLILRGEYAIILREVKIRNIPKQKVNQNEKA